ncbi:MAG: hypothetical protein IJP70_01710 [Bacteroidales bacterium]|nr:hypothetical protein [Bacteroidales bacterium]
MNSSVYIFGNLSSGYTQYPDEESTTSFFQKFYAKAIATTQIAIRRDGNLMYYAYIRKLENGKYIGLCVLLNGVALTAFKGLFSLFENTISNLVTKGYLIKYNDKGNLIANSDHLYMNREEIDLVSESLKGGFDNMQSSAIKLPPINYAISSESVKEFVIEDDAKEILSSSYTNGYTYIYKSKNYNTALMNSYQGVLSKISKENALLKKENESLKDENKKIKQQKKQFFYVILLCIAVIACGIGIILLKDSLSTTQYELKIANDTITEKDATIDSKNATIDSKNAQILELNSQIGSLQNSLSKEKSKREETEKRLNNLSNSISSDFPLLITDIDIANVYYDGTIETNYGRSIYSSHTMYLKPKITYTGIRTGERITLYVKLYKPSGTLSSGDSSPSGYSYSDSFTILSGEGNSYELPAWGNSNKGSWVQGSYRFEIWYKNICLRAKTIKVY